MGRVHALLSFMHSLAVNGNYGEDYGPQTHGSVLIADDDGADTFFLLRAFKTLDLHYPIHVVSSGEETIVFLSGKPPFQDRILFPIPHLLLLDLKMPKVGGFDVLQWMKTQRELEGLNVVVLSGSNWEKDIAKARELGAKDFIFKSNNTLDLVHSVREVTSKWLSCFIGSVCPPVPVTVERNSFNPDKAEPSTELG